MAPGCRLCHRHHSPELPPCAAETIDRPRAGKCLSIIKNACSVTHLGRHPRPLMICNSCVAGTWKKEKGLTPRPPWASLLRVSALKKTHLLRNIFMFEFYAMSAFLLACFRALCRSVLAAPAETQGLLVLLPLVPPNGGGFSIFSAGERCKFVVITQY